MNYSTSSNESILKNRLDFPHEHNFDLSLYKDSRFQKKTWGEADQQGHEWILPFVRIVVFCVFCSFAQSFDIQCIHGAYFA